MNKRAAMMDRALREAIDAMASPEIRDHVLRQALDSAGEEEIPEGGDRLRRFVSEYLGPTLKDRLGYDAADAILTSLEPIVQMATEEISQVRPATSVRAPAQDANNKVTPKAMPRVEPITAPAPPGPAGEDDWPELIVESRPRPASSGKVPALRPDAGAVGRDPEVVASRQTIPAPDRGLPIVLLATADAQQVEALDTLLAGHALLSGVHDPIGLLDALQAHGERQPVLIVDCRKPCVRPTTVAAMAPELPPGTTVVLWGADDLTESELEDVEPSSRDWIRCTAEATVQDLVSLCSMLLR